MVATMNGLIPPRWDEWERTAVPTLVAYGEHGMFAAEDKAGFCERGQSVRRVELEGASHDSHLDAFEPWIAALRSFLRG